MEIGIYEAKARLSELIQRVNGGTEVVITRHGAPVARIVPVKSSARSDRAKLVGEILSYGRTIRGPKLDLRRAIEDGRD